MSDFYGGSHQIPTSVRFDLKTIQYTYQRFTIIYAVIISNALYYALYSRRCASVFTALSLFCGAPTRFSVAVFSRILGVSIIPRIFEKLESGSSPYQRY
ncbi:MAG: hypothetical protein V3T49_08065 [Dehalococcoidia bacterium]